MMLTSVGDTGPAAVPLTTSCGTTVVEDVLPSAVRALASAHARAKATQLNSGEEVNIDRERSVVPPTLLR